MPTSSVKISETTYTFPSSKKSSGSATSATSSGLADTAGTCRITPKCDAYFNYIRRQIPVQTKQKKSQKDIAGRHDNYPSQWGSNDLSPAAAGAAQFYQSMGGPAGAGQPWMITVDRGSASNGHHHVSGTIEIVTVKTPHRQKQIPETSI